MNVSAIDQARKFIQTAYPEIPIPAKSYLVLSSARSGSILLCIHLERIGYGRPVEAFNSNENPRKQQNWGIDYSDPHAYMKKAIEFQTINGVMGMKLSAGQFELFLETAKKLLDPAGLALENHEIVEVFFPQVLYIHLERRKKLKQAISLAKALQNGIWHEVEGEDEDYKKYLMPVVYDREHIESCFDLSVVNDVYWRNYLRYENFTAHHIFYEDLASNYVEEMTAVYKFLGISGKEVIAPQLRKQANRETARWEERFIAETPWFSDPRISKPYESGDLDTLFLERCRMIVREREQLRWKAMPVNKYKKYRQLAYRVKRKTKSLFKNK